MKNRLAATIAALALATSAMFAQQNGQISGTAKNEAKSPYTDYAVQIRDARQGQIVGTTTLDSQGGFDLLDVPIGSYLVELINRDGKVLCSEGPYNLADQPTRNGVDISCNKKAAAWLILGAAAAAGITAGVVTTTDASASR